MKFDLGEVLSRSWQITWKNKVLWRFSLLPVLLSFLVVPLIFLPILFMNGSRFRGASFLREPIYFVIFYAVIILVNILGYILYGIATATVIRGVLRTNESAQKLSFTGLLNDGRKYWWRVMGVLLLIGLAISIIFFAIFSGMTLIGVATVGIGFICLQPIFLLMYPIMMVLYALVEVSQAAVVVDDLGVIASIQRGWRLVRTNFWRILLISLIVYFGIGLFSGIVILPFMTPFFIIPFLIQNQQFEINPQTMVWFVGAFVLLFIPVMALVQGISITFMKSTFTFVYLRLTKSQDNEPAAPIEANA